MDRFDATSWDELFPWLEGIENERRRLFEQSGMYVSDPLFRGQADASWPLSTTLERLYPQRMRMLDYYRRVLAAKPQIEAHTGKTWNTQSLAEYEKWVQDRRASIPDLPTLEYFAYLRHHGFPSPLLDWTESPFVAAYFAFGPATPRTARVAIFAYLEFAGGAKGSSSSTPSIQTIGPYIRSHKRHFLQRSNYTYCVVNEHGHWQYADHGRALSAIRDEPQDLLWCFTVPAQEREKALGHLDKFNLNAYSLLGSEESLMETVAFRELRG